VQYGQADPYGHLKLGGIGQLAADAIRELTGEHTIYQQLGYLMRSGAPDSLDLMVAVNYASMAVDLIKAGKSGRLVALREGRYTDVDMSIVRQGEKRVDVEQLYDVESYQPKVWHVHNKPMFLY